MFVFKMQSVLDAKKTQEEQALADFKAYSVLLEEEKGKLAAMEEQKEVLLMELRRSKNTTAKAASVDLHISYLKVWERRMAQQRVLILKMAQELEKRRQTLMTIMKDRKILENLKERHLADYRRQQSFQERRTADEMAILRHERKQP